jgi:hypothetical protein
MTAAISAVRKAGKEVAVITDRTDTPGGHQLTAFESLAPIPVSERAGMYVAAVGAGRLYRYNDQGEPVKIWESPLLEGEKRDKVRQASEALKPRLAQIGTSQFPGNGKCPAESWGPFSYGIMLAIGTPPAVVKQAALLFEAELKERGLDLKVSARTPKDPANPPYLQLFIVDKSASVGVISRALDIKPGQAVAIGDNMYAPQSPETPGRLARLAQRFVEALSGQPVGLTGNETDRNMERPLPGLLALSVGGTADSRMSNAYVLSGHGADATRQVLLAMASQPAETEPASDWKKAGAALARLLGIGGLF